MPVNPSSIVIELSRNALIDEFGHTTLKERYMLPDEPTPQHAFARACAAFADDVDHAQRLYDYVSKQWFMFATPLLSNGGTTRGLPISCFLTAIEDSRESISAHYDEVIWLSSTGGGIGTYYGDLREKGATTSKGSSSTGVIPFMGVDDRLILAVSQGGTRRGSMAVYLDVHHPEIREFIVLRKPNGGDQNRKALNLHNGVNITDEFLRCVKTGEPFALRSPKNNEIVGYDDARELWHLILETRKQTGEPYMFHVDEANRRLPEPQRRAGLRVRHSNLCVAPLTQVLTDDGYRPIKALVDQIVQVWNGEAWSTVTVKKTSDDAKLVRVWFEDGDYLDCTPEHKLYTDEGREVRAGELKAGLSMERAEHPVIDKVTDSDSVRDAVAYTAGWATFAGFEDESKLTIFAPESAGSVALRRLMTMSVDAAAQMGSENDQDIEGHRIRYERKTINAGVVPFSLSRRERLMWLGGVMDAVADWIEVDGEPYLSMGTPDRDMVRSMRLLALECGLKPTIRLSETLSAFMLHGSEVNLVMEGDYCARHDSLSDDSDSTSSPNYGENPAERVIVSDVQPLPFKSETYCFTEEQRHRGVFAGYLTGQCTEITLATGRDQHGRKRTAVCCLSRVNGETFDQWTSNKRFIPDLMRMLDNVLTDFITNAPAGLKDAVYSARMERSVGLGLLGFHSYLQRHMVPFESEQARQINSLLFRHLRQGADEASLALGAERGEAPDMAGTGHRFTHRMAVAPNASSSILCGNTSPSVEPWRANVFLQKTLSGSYPQKNPYLVKALESLALNTPFVWKAIIEGEGSIQKLDDVRLNDQEEVMPTILEEAGYEGDMEMWHQVKEVFKTANELKQRWIIQHAIDRKDDIDQAQSINLFYPADADADEISRDHYVALSSGLKSLYYLRSTAPQRGENVNKTVTKIKHKDAVEDDLGALVGSAMVREDPACPSCEG